MLWAWETPEDLTALNAGPAPRRTGVAFLSREILLNPSLTVRPRHQPLRISPGTYLMAVVRIQTGPHFNSSQADPTAIAQAIAAAAQAPNVRALQIDFDATASQRTLYAAILRQLRPRLPPDMPLSITALVSWCRGAGLFPTTWLHNLSGVAEAVPMFFRMGGPAANRATSPRSAATLTEPLCTTSVGLATDESWPAIQPTQRVYLFRPGPWTPQDLDRLNTFGYQSLKR
jgi:hypothetical protein